MTITQKVTNILIKRGHNVESAERLVSENLSIAIKCFPDGSNALYADFVSSVN